MNLEEFKNAISKLIVNYQFSLQLRDIDTILEEERENLCKNLSYTDLVSYSADDVERMLYDFQYNVYNRLLDKRNEEKEVIQ